MFDPVPASTNRLIRDVDNEDDELSARLGLARDARKGTGEGQGAIGARIADRVASTVGSWPFIIAQSMVLLVWIVLNLAAVVRHWDPYPFILLNLALSFQAAYAAPFIMMSQNRQAAIDRAAAESAYDTDIEAELEIELLHKKLDRLRDGELTQILLMLEDLRRERAETLLPPATPGLG